MKTTQIQKNRVLKHLRNHRAITTLQAMNKYGIMSLSSRISELKNDGISINSKRVKVNNRYKETCYVAEYSLK